MKRHLAAFIEPYLEAGNIPEFHYYWCNQRLIQLFGIKTFVGHRQNAYDPQDY